ncbi:thioredoxin-like protein [Chytriomyces sp. MP71]|nr:thioredoxin-like protein [Chytriomyces sp. MP71]
MLKPILALAALFVAALASDVVVLTEDNFDTLIDGTRPALVDFYGPTCTACINLAPIYEDLATAFARHKPNLLIAKLDATAYPSVARRFGVTGYPEMHWFPRGKPAQPERYKGFPALADLAWYVSQQTGLLSSVRKAASYVRILESVQAVQELSSGMVTFCVAWCEKCRRFMEVYERVARAFASEPNCIVASIDVDRVTEFGGEYYAAGEPTIKYFAGGKFTGLTYEGKQTENDLMAFLNSKCGTDRSVGGRLGPKVGLVEIMDGMVKQFKVSNGPDARIRISEEAETVARTMPENQYASYYWKVMLRILKDGDAYVDKELTRLDKMIESGDNSPAKQDNFIIRRNIVRLFASTPSSGDELSKGHEL